MSDATRVELVTCNDCGASNAAKAGKCWLCQRAFGSPGTTASGSTSPPPLPIGTSPFGDEAQSIEARRGVWTITLSSIFIFMTLVAVGFGLAQLEPGLAVWYAIVVAPAYTATAITTITRRAKGRPMTRGEQLSIFGMATGITLIAIPCLAIAAAGAFFLYCLMALGR